MRVAPLLSHPWEPLVTCDGRAYHAMAVAWAQGRGLSIEDPQLVAMCGNQISLGPSHHFAPALAWFEGLFVIALGDTALALALPLLLLSIAAVAVAWATTADLFGRDAALLVAACVSLEWTGVHYATFFGYPENLVVIAVTLTLWAILRGLRDYRFIVLAGAFASLGYLSKANIGWFFLIAGVGGIAYRVRFRGWRVLTNRWYLLGAAIFGLTVATWAYRNVSLFWDGTLPTLLDAAQTSELHSRIMAEAFAAPVQLLIGLAGKFPLLAGALTLPVLPLARALAGAVGRWREEDIFGLWLAVGLIFVLGWFFAAAFWAAEPRNMLWADSIRYVSVAQVPVLWLAVRGGPSSRSAWLAVLLILLLTCLVMPTLSEPGQFFGRGDYL